MPIPCLLITIHLVKIPLTTLDNNNKITNKGISSLNKLRKTLNTFQYKNDVNKTQKNPLCQKCHSMTGPFLLDQSFTPFVVKLDLSFMPLVVLQDQSQNVIMGIVNFFMLKIHNHIEEQISSKKLWNLHQEKLQLWRLQWFPLTCIQLAMFSKRSTLAT